MRQYQQNYYEHILRMTTDRKLFGYHSKRGEREVDHWRAWRTNSGSERAKRFKPYRWWWWLWLWLCCWHLKYSRLWILLLRSFGLRRREIPQIPLFWRNLLIPSSESQLNKLAETIKLLIYIREYSVRISGGAPAILIYFSSGFVVSLDKFRDNILN